MDVRQAVAALCVVAGLLCVSEGARVTIRDGSVSDFVKRIPLSARSVDQGKITSRAVAEGDAVVRPVRVHSSLRIARDENLQKRASDYKIRADGARAFMNFLKSLG